MGGGGGGGGDPGDDDPGNNDNPGDNQEDDEEDVPRYNRGGFEPHGNVDQDDILRSLTRTQAAQAQTSQDIARLLAQRGQGPRGHVDGRQNLSYQNYHMALRTLQYFTGQPPTNFKDVPSSARNNVEARVDIWVTNFEQMVNSWQLNAYEQKLAFFDRVVGEAGSQLKQFRQLDCTIEELLQHLSLRFYTYRTYKSVCEEIQSLTPLTGETLAMFVGRIELLCREHRKLTPVQITPQFERLKVFDTFLMKVATPKLIEKLTSEGITGDDMTTVIRVSQSYFDNHEIKPWAMRFILKAADPNKDSIKVANASKSKTGNASSVKTFNGECHICKKHGHMARDCLNKGRFNSIIPKDSAPTPQTSQPPPMSHPPRPSNSTPSSGPRPCNWCGSTDHTSYQCPLYEKCITHHANKNRGGGGGRGGRGRGGRGTSIRGGARGGNRGRGRGYQNGRSANAVGSGDLNADGEAQVGQVGGANELGDDNDEFYVETMFGDQENY